MAKKPVAADKPLCFDPYHKEAREVFCAALAGICASDAVIALIHGGSVPAAIEFAVSFAEAVVVEVRKREPK